MALHVGSLLAGRYEITAPIATGGMGEVWQALDRVLDRTVAAKVLRSEYSGDQSFLARFRNEARHTAALSHPNIASVYDYGETTDPDADGRSLAYLVMEYVQGQPLVTILAEQGRLSPERTLDVLGQAADGLSAAHRAGVVHRDIKPGNLLVRPDGVVKLTDFGIARARDATPLTRTGMVVGTAQYLSPEQAQGFEVTPASDVYSLGVLGYECLVGRRPFDGESQVAIALAQVNRPPPPLPPDVPPAVRTLIDRALAKDPAARFPDGAAFAAAVRDVARGRSVPPVAVPDAPTQVVAMDPSSTRVLPAAGVVGAAGSLPRTAAQGRAMPPLRGTPVNDATAWDDRPVGRPPGGDRRRVWPWVLAALVLLLLAGGVAYALTLAGDDAGGGTTPTTTTTVSTTVPPSSATRSTASDGERTTTGSTTTAAPTTTAATTTAAPTTKPTPTTAATTTARPTTTAPTTTAATASSAAGSGTTAASNGLGGGTTDGGAGPVPVPPQPGGRGGGGG